MTDSFVSPTPTHRSGVLEPLRALSIDIETNPADNNRIFKLGAVRSKDDAGLTLSVSRSGTAEVVSRVNRFAANSQVVVGHNLRRHDLPRLKQQLPGLSVADLPLVDTLEWSALAFPTNPYHRLVKGYKLLSDSRNDPQRDARLTLALLEDEHQAFRQMRLDDPEWVAILHHLVAVDAPLAAALETARSSAAPTADVASELIRHRFVELTCSTQLMALSAPTRLADSGQRLSLAYALGWIRVSGGNSVLPLWVHNTMPEVRQRIHELRETNCGQLGCAYCRVHHDPESLLQRFFQKSSFRPKPAAADGTSLQRAIVEAGLARQGLLAVLPTGGGKSICYQLPALVHYTRAGQLTVIISPLQSLMKDQVDNLLAAGVMCAVTINGLLTPLERRSALDKIRLGDAGIVLVSPEQFRSRTFTEAISHREIAGWVFDEAHCLSKWGHDFRTDYLYVSRFIREHLSHRPAPVACFTATAKPDVIEDLCEHFRTSLGTELKTFLGGHQRDNLSYLVSPTPRTQKTQRINEILQHELKQGGAAVVFCATRKTTEELAQQLVSAGFEAACFHGGLPSEEKKDIQNRFLAGELKVIAATNAFGMGVDKPDIRVVIHADIPGSLENYLQEAGRAGRDGDSSRCVLLFDEHDVESQFRLSASSQLTPKDFSGLLRSVRARVKRLKTDEIVVSAKELLAESEGTSIDIEASDATTKVTTAIAWLERSGFLKRDENASRVFPASLRVPTLEAAIERINQANLPEVTRGRYIAVAAGLFSNLAPDGLSTDELMLDAGIAPEECFRILYQLEKLGILANDLGLSVRISKGVKGASDSRLEILDRVERALLDLMTEGAPDAEVGGEAMHLNPRLVCTELRQRLNIPDGSTAINPQSLRDCLLALTDSFGAGNEQRSMLRVQGSGSDNLRVRLLRPWSQIRSICERRRAVAGVVLRKLMANIPEGTREANRIVECKARELLDAIESDLELQQTIKEPAVALEHALLYMHQNKVLELDKGRSVFRSAMTLRVAPESQRRRFAKEDFEPLKEFYRERTLQTHVMHEYAKLGSSDARAAAALVDAYFNWPRKKFVREFFKGRTDLLELATTEESFRRIVDDLNHQVQQALVEKPEVGNHLVLAGPGSGKTRVIVHRIAYLVRVRRVSPDRIIALAFNRSAAAELRRRLNQLIGDDARGISVLTYHAMALRLTGTSLAASDRAGQEIDFAKLINDAIALLEGSQDGWLEADDMRDRLLQGYEYIFVDEYQDIDEQQYGLISALAGRRRSDPDAKLSVTAVGDDDQNIYSFKGANVEFIRRFQRDYGGEVTYLVENFRSTQNIITVSNHVIQRGGQRMKVDHPIRINQSRSTDAPGGRWSYLDPQNQGRVRLITAPADANRQAQLVGTEIDRLRRREPGLQLGQIAVLARTHKSLEPLRALLELEGIAYEIQGRDDAASRLPLMRSRQGWTLAQLLTQRRTRLVRVSSVSRYLGTWLRKHPSDPYWLDLQTAVQDLASTTQTQQVTGGELLEALYEFAADLRCEGHPSAVKLMTAHGAKGLEFGHVIIMDCADWQWQSEDERRLLYVAMTRAKESLVLMRAEGGRNPYLVDVGTLDAVVDTLPETRPVPRPELNRRYMALGPADLDVGYAGRFAAEHPIHQRLASLQTGSPVLIRNRHVTTPDGDAIGRLANKTVLSGEIVKAHVSGILMMTREQSAAEFKAGILVPAWNVPMIGVALAEPMA